MGTDDVETEWQEYRDLDPGTLAGLVACRRIVDARNALDTDRWRSHGWAVRAIGRPRMAPCTA